MVPGYSDWKSAINPAGENGAGRSSPGHFAIPCRALVKNPAVRVQVSSRPTDKAPALAGPSMPPDPFSLYNLNRSFTSSTAARAVPRIKFPWGKYDRIPR